MNVRLCGEYLLTVSYLRWNGRQLDMPDSSDRLSVYGGCRNTARRDHDLVEVPLEF